jgi:ABC-2 type transport system ATP-binding protein
VRDTSRRVGQIKTILLSTHILQEVEAMASRVLFINEGRLVYDGTPRDLTSDGKPLDEHFHQLTAAPAA